ncbi:hypothetical protein BT96DRAFT_1077557 [Gymnopus androsaceus JB14]|uniref:Uncharacterized protein n=1 Tax=Gymnopus androsaceus JB14 TaxID=1447944 RepID=A0A6A4IKD5_9AGAR|nr:hypothetical protein BT96DRAFT_1077557 [Gymnopus androsaceus JB14]
MPSSWLWNLENSAGAGAGFEDGWMIFSVRLKRNSEELRCNTPSHDITDNLLISSFFEYKFGHCRSMNDEEKKIKTSRSGSRFENVTRPGPRRHSVASRDNDITAHDYIHHSFLPSFILTSTIMESLLNSAGMLDLVHELNTSCKFICQLDSLFSCSSLLVFGHVEDSSLDHAAGEEVMFVVFVEHKWLPAVYPSQPSTSIFSTHPKPAAAPSRPRGDTRLSFRRGEKHLGMDEYERGEVVYKPIFKGSFCKNRDRIIVGGAGRDLGENTSKSRVQAQALLTRLGLMLAERRVTGIRMQNAGKRLPSLKRRFELREELGSVRAHHSLACRPHMELTGKPANDTFAEGACVNIQITWTILLLDSNNHFSLYPLAGWQISELYPHNSIPLL